MNNQFINQNQTEQQPITQPAGQPQPFLSKLNWKYVGIGLFVVLVVGVGAFWVGKKINQDISGIIKPTSISTITEDIEKVNNTIQSNRTYQNTQYNFQILYPQDWTYQENQSGHPNVKFQSADHKEEVDIMINWIGSWMGNKYAEEAITIDDLPATLEVWLGGCSMPNEEEMTQCFQNLSIDNYERGWIVVRFEKDNNSFLIDGYRWQRGEADIQTQIDKMKQFVSSFRFF